MRADHSSSRSGWALGEQAMYCKMANFELQTRVPMMVRAPWLKSTGSTTALAELVDMCAEPSRSRFGDMSPPEGTDTFDCI